MSSQTPGGDPPPDPATPPTDPVAPEPDAEAVRVPVGETPPEDPAPPPAAGIISANPVGWTGPALDTTGGPAGGPASAWASPVQQTAVPVADGLVIAGVFARLVAYSVDLVVLSSVSVAVNGVLGLYTTGRDDAVALIVSGLLVGAEFLYFVGLWTSGWRGTLGMRLLRLRVLGAATAGAIPANDALLRWLALSGAVSILTLVPGIGPDIGLIGVIWVLVLLISTGMHPLHQGLHDRWARSVVVQPAPGGSGAAIAGCLVLVVLIVFVLPLVLVALVGDQIQVLLSQIGASV